VTTALEGDLAHFYPGEVLQFLQLAQGEGRLELTRGSERAEIFLERGRPVFARTSAQSVKAGEILIHRGVLRPEDLERALARQQDHPGRRVGQMLVAAGMITPAELEAAVQDVLKRIVYGVLLWREGRFRFHPGERAENEDIQLDLELDRMILEGLRLADSARAQR
jgi:hypothetical protein